MKADDYAREARRLMEERPLRSKVYTGVPVAEDGPVDDFDVAVEIVRRLLSEVKAIADARRVQTKEAILSIMLELRQRWYAVCDRMKGNEAFKRTLFMAVVAEHDRFRQVLPPGQ